MSDRALSLIEERPLVPGRHVRWGFTLVATRAGRQMASPAFDWGNTGMPQTPHVEKHFTAGATVRDVVIGMSDGLTVPFALAAGLSGAIAVSHIVVTAGLAEIAAGSIAMGLGGYLAARSDAEHYASERLREQREVSQIPEAEAKEVTDFLASYGINPVESTPVVADLRNRPMAWVDFVMRFD